MMHSSGCNFQIHLKILYISLLAFTLSFTLISCTTKRPVTRDQSQVYLEKEIADANKKIEEIYHRVSVIQFMVDNHEKAIRDMEKSAQSSKSSPSKTAVKASVSSKPSLIATQTEEKITAEQLYNLARTDYNSQNYQKASERFSLFIEKYPNHDLSDNAIYWNGESFYAQKNYTNAIKQFQNLINNYPDGSKVPDALLKTGYSFLSIKDPENARKYLKKVTRNYPFSPAASKAADMLKKIKSK